MNSAVEDIKARINIVDLIGEYVRLQKAGTTWKGLCPFHHEKSPSFVVNEEKQFWHCFGCAKGGDAFAFIMEIDSLGFREALGLLAEKTGVQLEQYNPKETDNKNKALEILELATKFYETQLWQGMGKGKVLSYLHERGIAEESIRQFRLGYAPPGWDNILKFLLARGYTTDDIQKTGLLVQKNVEQPLLAGSQSSANYYDRFRSRIMFPIADPFGKIIGYSARVAPGEDESQAKYINTPESSVYHKGKALYGIYHAKNDIKQKNFTLLVEGNMDVIAAHQAGIKNTVAVSGTALTVEQLDILKRYGASVSMFFDMDSAGQQAAVRSADLCFEKGIAVKMVQLSEGKDAADVAQKNPKILVDAVANAPEAMEYFFQKAVTTHNKDIADEKKAIAAETLNHIKHFSSEIEKSHWIKKLAQELEVEEKAIFGVLQALEKPQLRSFENENSDDESSDDTFEKRSIILRDKIAGIAMSDPLVWQETEVIFSDNKHLQSDSFLKYIFSKGKDCKFSFDLLLLKTEEDSMRKTLQKMYFDAKYHFDSSQNIIEYTDKEKQDLAKHYIREYVKELQKEQLSSIIRNIREAEQRGDKERTKELMAQFTKLSQELK